MCVAALYSGLVQEVLYPETNDMDLIAGKLNFTQFFINPLVGILTILLTCPSVYSEIADLPLATPFFRNPQSNFPSGQANRQALERQILSTETNTGVKAKWNQKEYWLQREQVIMEIDCATKAVLNEASGIYKESASNSSLLGRLAAESEVNILETRAYWSLVHNKNLNIKGWIPSQKLRLNNEDLGVFVTLIDTFMRMSPKQGAMVVTTIPRGQKLPVLSFENGFLRTEYRGQKAYVDLNHLVSRADFANWVFQKNNSWQLVSHRENEFIVTKEHDKIPMDEVIAFSSLEQKAVFSLSLSPDNPPIRSFLKILTAPTDVWIKSRLSGHGEVWWQRKSPEAKPEVENLIDSDDLLKKDIFSMSITGKNKIQGLISAGAIYRSTDGQHWQKIKQFGNKDFPVGIFNGIWYVGGSRSLDQGKTWEPYIRWDQLAELIQKKTVLPPKHIRMLKIESSDDAKLKIQIDTGAKRLSIYRQTDSQAWRVME